MYIILNIHILLCVYNMHYMNASVCKIQFPLPLYLPSHFSPNPYDQLVIWPPLQWCTSIPTYIISRQAGVYQKWITAILRCTYVHFLKGKYHKYQCKRHLSNNRVLLKFSTRFQIFARINISKKRTFTKLKLFKNKNYDK